MKKQKLKNSIKLGILILSITLCFTNCEADKDIIEESDLEHQTPTVLSEKISFTQSKHFSEINSEIKSIQTKFNKRQTSKENQSETGSLKILTDEVLYVTYAGTHTYTFKVVRKNPTYLLENIVLHYNLRTKSYDEYLMQYKDLKEQDIKEISEGKLFQDSKKVIVTKLENVFFESYSSSNKASSTSKASSVICNTVTSTIFVNCSSGEHHSGNIRSWGECTASLLPYAYQSASTTCTVVSGPLTVAIEESSPSSGGGGGNDPNAVVYNPLPLELCSDSADVVDLNGNCLQPIDVAVSYIANCLSSSYSTTLSQNEINFLYSTTSSFEIKSYLENNGCSSENIAFVKEMINTSILLDVNAVSIWNDYDNFKKQMASTEKVLFDNLLPNRKLWYMCAAKKAVDKAKELFPTSLHNGKGDALRHALWNGISTLLIGNELTKQLTDAHESKPAPLGDKFNYKEVEMDLYNNNKGRETAMVSNITNIIETIINDLSAGYLRYLNNLDSNSLATYNSSLIPTDQ